MMSITRVVSKMGWSCDVSKFGISHGNEEKGGDMIIIYDYQTNT